MLRRLSSTLTHFKALGCRRQAIQHEVPEWQGEFCKGLAMTRDYKNPFDPQPAANCRYGIRKGDSLFAGPVDGAQAPVARGHLRVEHRDHAVQSEQTRG